MTQALWFASRACGLVTLLLLTAVVALGALHTGRVASRSWPRFALQSLHRNLAFLALLFLAVHVATATIDPYAGIRWWDAVRAVRVDLPSVLDGPGRGRADLLVALVLTSVLRIWLRCGCGAGCTSRLTRCGRWRSRTGWASGVPTVPASGCRSSTADAPSPSPSPS